MPAHPGARPVFTVWFREISTSVYHSVFSANGDRVEQIEYKCDYYG
ncbi:hypothetical protein LT85_3796 [Collimonas arenae]|uniref:Uncharacterized protein n=1 Tax=Collimonas arenae TaxID=279058 RepID=A0A0A1FH47_9BURK|nr:hypothetical protein LT85_3796 [Collimonas arenae]